MTHPDYLACTKSPPSDVPEVMRKGLGPCLAPRNHDGPCQYPREGGGRAMLFPLGGDPVTMVEEIRMYHAKARRAFKVAFYCSMVSAASAAWLLMDVIGSIVNR